MTTPHWMSRVCHRLRRVAKDTQDGGFTLVEVLVSFVIFAAVAGSAATGIVNALRASHVSQQRVDAADVAQSFVADAISTATKVVPEEGKTIISNVGDGIVAGGETFTVIRWITFDAGDTCHPGALFTVNIEVHQAQTNQFLARSDARVACPPV
jgi:prepilin-type N-terminal cleavage/methylation domain-containing protein